MHDACQVGKSSRVHHCLVPYPTIRPRGASRSSFPPRARRTSLNFCLSWASAIRLELSERWAPQLLLRLFFIGPYHLAAGRTWAAGPPHVIDLLQLTRYLYLLPPCLRKVVSSGFAGVRALMHLIHGGPEKNV
jgi:hypothetical protein